MWTPQFAVAWLPMGAILLVGIEQRKKKGKRKDRRQWLPFLLLMCAWLALLIGCGGGNSSGQPGGTQPKSYTVQVQGTTAAQPNPITITTVSLTVQ